MSAPAFPLHIALVGDCSPEVVAHTAIPRALALAAGQIGREVAAVWFPTNALQTDAASQLGVCQGVWCVPGSPYASMDGALNAIRFAREQGIPFLGTCGGFQHALIEYARNVLGLHDADHAESNPAAALPLVTPLSCSLRERRADIALVPGSLAANACGSTQLTEMFNCGYGLNESLRDRLNGGPLRVCGVAADDSVRVVELAGHPFFLATLFQPERAALENRAHPLITAFVRAAASV